MSHVYQQGVRSSNSLVTANATCRGVGGRYWGRIFGATSLLGLIGAAAHEIETVTT